MKATMFGQNKDAPKHGYYVAKIKISFFCIYLVLLKRHKNETLDADPPRARFPACMFVTISGNKWKMLFPVGRQSHHKLITFTS